MVQKIPYHQFTGNTVTLGSSTSRVVMGADSGNLIGEDTTGNHSYAGATTFRVGADNGPNYQIRNCYISSLRMIQGQALYSNSFTPPSALLVG